MNKTTWYEFFTLICAAFTIMFISLFIYEFDSISRLSILVAFLGGMFYAMILNKFRIHL